jgi:UDP-N-acetylmuramate--alanine ligase
MRKAYVEFVSRVVRGGVLVVCGEDVETRQLGMQGLSQDRRMETYGLDSGSDWWAEGMELGNSAAFQVRHQGIQLGMCALQVPGRHNVLNALAALAASAEAGVAFGPAAAALTRFRGIERRFQVKGHVAGITVVDDYAHHPTEIQATLAAARIKYPGRTIWAVFQPHTYSRTAALLDDFAASFGSADHVLVTSIYAAREKDTLGVSGRDLAFQIDHPDVQYVGSLEEAVTLLLKRIESGDVMITLGAGDGYLVGEQVLGKLGIRENGE